MPKTQFDSPIQEVVVIPFAKQHALELALLGGPRLFANPIHVGRPNLPDSNQAITRFREILERGWLSNDGPYVKRFESQVAEMLGVRHCVSTCNATVGLQLAVVAANLKGEVIVPSFTFAATAHVLAWQGIKPVFADIDSVTWTLDPASVESLVTPQTTGILGVHLFGTACSIAPLRELAQRHHLRLLFDASHALGCSEANEPIGNFGDAEVFSFHATKFINAAEGGAITTNDDTMAARLRSLRSFGFDSAGEVQGVGINGKMSELAAALGLTHLEHAREIIGVNRYNHALYCDLLAGIEGIQVRAIPPGEQSNYHYVVVEIDETKLGLCRDQVVAVLRAENVLARRYFVPGCHRLPPYAAAHASASVSLPQTEAALERVMVLPNGMAINKQHVQKICRLLRFVADNAPSIQAHCIAHAGECLAALDPPRTSGLMNTRSPVPSSGETRWAEEMNITG